MAHKLVAASLSVGLLQACGSSVSPVVLTPTPTPMPTPTPTAPLPIAGPYRFTIVVDPECRDRFPKAFQARSYDVDIRPVIDRSEIWFLNPDVRAYPHTDDPPGIGFVSSFETGGSYDLVFRFNDDHSLGEVNVYSSWVELSTVSSIPLPQSGRFAGPLYGNIGYADPKTTGDCISSSHSFVLNPR